MQNKCIFTPPSPLKTAVLFLIFNRLDITKLVFEVIKAVKPPRLYIAADGARESIDGEESDVQLVRDYVLSQIDWDCEVETLFREKNLGCKYAVSGAIDWFFNNEEMGIILEDDCLPSQSFFWFCEEMLERYRDDTRVGQISGTNVLGEYQVDSYSYHFSNYGSIWGWATWRRAWEYYDVVMTLFPSVQDRGLLRSVIINKNEYAARMNDFNLTYENKVDTWDFQWIFARLINRMIIIIPYRNLVSNIGFGVNATHTYDICSPFSKQKRFDLDWPIRNVECYLPNSEFEYRVHKKKNRSIFRKLTGKLKFIGGRIWGKK